MYAIPKNKELGANNHPASRWASIKFKATLLQHLAVFMMMMMLMTMLCLPKTERIIDWLSCHNLLNVPQFDFPSGKGFDLIQSPQEYICRNGVYKKNFQNH